MCDAVLRQICSHLEQLVACTLQMLIVTTRETIRVVILIVLTQESNIFKNLTFFFAYSHHNTALAEIAQTSVMVHVLIGEYLLFTQHSYSCIIDVLLLFI